MSSRSPFWLCLWPGLARLWVLGDAVSLIVAIGFGVLLQVALAVTFLWPELWGAGISPAWSAGVTWVFVLWFWVTGLRSGQTFRRQQGAQQQVGPDETVDQLFVDAQTSYLKGHWIEAETAIEDLLARRPEDMEARLLLAGIFRRTKRFDLAQQELEQIQDLPGMGRWRFEIGRELELLSELVEETAEKKAGTNSKEGVVAVVGNKSAGGGNRGAKVA